MERGLIILERRPEYKPRHESPLETDSRSDPHTPVEDWVINGKAIVKHIDGGSFFDDK